MAPFATNLRRLIAREGITLSEFARRAQLDLRTVKAVVSGKNQRPHARTLHRLAAGLSVDVDELFQDRSVSAQSEFDQATNPHVKELVTSQPELFVDWTQPDFDELYSQVGTGGALTPEGALAATRWINRRREVHAKVDLILETAESELLLGIIDVVYRRVVVSDS